MDGELCIQGLVKWVCLIKRGPVLVIYVTILASEMCEERLAMHARKSVWGTSVPTINV